MEIHILDWIIYIIVIAFIANLISRTIKEDDMERGIAGCVTLFVVTIIYCLIFWEFNWIDIFIWIRNNTNIHL